MAVPNQTAPQLFLLEQNAHEKALLKNHYTYNTFNYVCTLKPKYPATGYCMPFL